MSQTEWSDLGVSGLPTGTVTSALALLDHTLRDQSPPGSSQRTVQTHLTHVCTTLGLTSRVQLAQEAARRT